MASFRDLPLELFIAILEALIHTTHPKNHSTTLKVLFLVSKEWKDISQSTSSLWRTLSSEDPPAWVERVLRNSSPDGPLNVRFVRYIESRFQTQWFEAIIIPHLTRWVDFHLDWPHAPWNGGILITRAVNLRCLSTWRGEKSSPPPFNYQSIQLHDNQGISWRSNQIRSTSLQRLFLYKAPHNFVSMPTLLNTLLSCPNLTHLVVHEIRLTGISLEEDDPPVVLPHLTHMDVQFTTVAARYIFKRFQLPALVEFALEIPTQGGYVNPQPWERLVEVLIPILLQLAQRPTTHSDFQFALQLAYDAWVLKTYSGSFSFGMQYHLDSYLQSLLLPLGEVSAALICAEPKAGRLIDQLISMSRILPSAVHLKLPDPCGTKFYLVLKAMTTRSFASGKELFPKLRMLELAAVSRVGTVPEWIGAVEKLMEARTSLVVRNLCPKVEVEEEVEELSRRFPNSFVFVDDDVEVEWWDRPQKSMDPDYEEYPYTENE